MRDYINIKDFNNALIIDRNLISSIDVNYNDKIITIFCFINDEIEDRTFQYDDVDEFKDIVNSINKRMK